MLNVFSKLYKVNLVSPRGLYILFAAFMKHGINLMAVLQFASKINPNKIAIKDSNDELTYLKLYKESYQLAIVLKNEFSIHEKNKIALLCKNHNIAIQSLFAFSRLGSNITFLNIEMSQEQITKIIQQKNFDLLVYDNDFENKLENINCLSIPIFKNKGRSISEMIVAPFQKNKKLKRRNTGNISVLTGGTSGRVKLAKRQPTIMSLIMPFLSLLDQLNLHKYKTVYIAVPMYHGYGLASLIVAMVLNAKIITRKKFNTNEALELIQKNKIEIAILVPTMLKRMLDIDEGTLRNLKGILSGGAALNESLVKRVFEKIGDVLFNLYGTSEAGFSVLAIPQDLKKYPNTIGRKIRGVSLKILDKFGKEVGDGETGIIHIKASWSMENMKDRYVSTGDMGYMNKEGYLFLKGRSDDMIVSGGENVYPKDLELALLGNEQIEEAVAIAVEDQDFGKRLVTFVVLQSKSKDLDSEALKKWLTTRVARFQMPHKIIIIDSLPMTKTGKVDKKVLVKKFETLPS